MISKILKKGAVYILYIDKAAAGSLTMTSLKIDKE